MTTNDKTRDVLRLLTLAVEQNRNCDFNSEHPAVESAMKEAYAALASTPAQPAEHRPGCDALGGYGYGVGVCDCGAVEAQTPVAAVPEGWTLAPDYRGFANLGTGQYVINHSAAGAPAELVISVATDDDKAGRAVGESRDNPDGLKIQPEQMAVRLRFAAVSGLDALEVQLHHVREAHFAATPTPDPAAQGDDWRSVTDQMPPPCTEVLALGRPYGTKKEIIRCEFVTYINTRPRECVEDEEITHWKPKSALAAPERASSAQGESPTRQTDLSKKLRLLYEALGHPHNVFDRRHLLQASDEIERYYGGMLAWKHTAEAKDRQLSELTAPERAEVRPPVLTESYPLADALYRAGYEDRSRGRDYDPRGCLEWQSVVDAIHPHSAADSAQGGATGVSNAD